MNYLPRFLTADVPYENFSDKLALSGEMFLRGIGTVFIVLALLWGIIELFSYISTAGERQSAKAKAEAEAREAKKAAALAEAPKPLTNIDTRPTENSTEVLPAPLQDDGAIVAAIMAAISAYRAAEGTYNLPYRVVSFKRKNTKNSRG